MIGPGLYRAIIGYFQQRAVTSDSLTADDEFRMQFPLDSKFPSLRSNVYFRITVFYTSILLSSYSYTSISYHLILLYVVFHDATYIR